MYDPRIGRFLDEDPTGFAAGDTNLYRYTGNNATNATDPSGLQGDARQALPPQVGGRYQFTPIEDPLERSNLPTLYGRPFRARIFFDSPASTDADAELRKQVLNAIQEAAHRIDRALYVLENYWPEIQVRFRENVEVNHAFDGNQRQYFLDQLRNIYQNLTNPASTIHFDIHNQPSGDKYASVFFFWRYRIGSTINIYPMFFVDDGQQRTSRQQSKTIIHEFGRFFAEISDGDAIVRWDNLIMTLSQRADELIEMRHPNGRPLVVPPAIGCQR
jgi:uncharacterized protein RhaS with RHS repeats